MRKYIADKECFFIAKNPSYHYGKLMAGQVIQTGQEELDIYDRFDEWRLQLIFDEKITQEHDYVNDEFVIIEAIN